MSYDLMVFEKTKAPKDRKSFIAWYKKLTKWDEGHSYDNPEICSEALKNWFMEMKETFSQMNGPYSLDEEIIDNDENIENHVTDYSIAKDAIYAAFAWSCADEAYNRTVILAKKHDVGFFDVSSEDLDIVFPGTTEMEVLEKKAWFDIWNEKNEYQKIIDAINSMPKEQIGCDIVLSKAVAYNNIKDYDKAIETILSIEHEIMENEAHPNYVLGYAYHFQKKYEECIKYVEKSILLDDWEKQNMDILAYSYYHIGKKEKSNEIIHEYIELRIDDEEYQDVVGAVLEFPKEDRDEWMNEKLEEAYKELQELGQDKELTDILSYYWIDEDKSLQMLKDYVSQKIKDGEKDKAKKAILEYPKKDSDDEIKKYLKMCE